MNKLYISQAIPQIAYLRPKNARVLATHMLTRWQHEPDDPAPDLTLIIREDSTLFYFRQSFAESQAYIFSHQVPYDEFLGDLSDLFRTQGEETDIIPATYMVRQSIEELVTPYESAHIEEISPLLVTPPPEIASPTLKQIIRLRYYPTQTLLET